MSVFRTYLDREHDCLAVFGDPAPLHQDLDLHLLSCGIQLDPVMMRLLRDGLSAMALYLVSRPRFESFGWTVSLTDPRANLFFAGTQLENTVVGRVFLENIKTIPKSRFYAQIRRPFSPLQTSSLEVEGADMLWIVEQYCLKSDQQDARLFRGDGERVALVSALPNVDREWFRGLESKEVFRLESAGAIDLVNERTMAFRCGCDSEWIARALASMFGEAPESLFRGDMDVEAECPRCGATHRIARKTFDRMLSRKEAASENETGESGEAPTPPPDAIN